MDYRGWLSFWTLAVLVSCAPDDHRGPPRVEIADSAGIRLVQIPPLSTFALPEARAELVFSTRDVRGENLELFAVADGLILPDGSLVLANRGTSEIIVIDPSGSSLTRTGRRGDGPGEFQMLSRLVPTQNGGFRAFDVGTSRFSEFDASGALQASRRLTTSPVVSLVPLAVAPDNSVVAVTGEQRYFTPGFRRDTVSMLVYSEGIEHPDTIGSWLGLERTIVSLTNSRLMVPIGFGRTALHASNGGRTVHGSTDSLDLTVYRASQEPEPVMRVVAGREPGSPSPSDQEWWIEELLQRLPREAPDVEGAFREAQVRDAYPGFAGLAIDAEGRIWIGEAAFRTDERRWVVLSPEGRPVFQVELPGVRFERLPGRTELLAVGVDRVAILRHNRFDEEYVEVWKIEPPS